MLCYGSTEAQSEKQKAQRAKTQLGGFGKTQTVQSEKDNCCIHNIIKRAQHTGFMPVHQKPNIGGNYIYTEDFQSAMNTVVAGQRAFDELPSKIRKDFDNDPVEFLKFVHDPKNEQKLVEMGLVNAKPDPKPEPIPAPTQPPAA